MKKGVCLLFIFLIFIFVANWTNSYDNLVTHPRLTEVGMNQYQAETGKALTDKQRQLIVQGSINEDVLPRPYNHFYDPSTGLGLNGEHWTAKEWALNGGWGGATGDFSEKAILENYQNGNKERAYEGIGHITHLIQDMAVPAHVRNDDHRYGDIYESWTQYNGQINISDAKYIEVSNLGQAFDDLASFTHNNFLSKDTVGRDFLIDRKNVRNETINSEEVSFYYKNGYRLAIVDMAGLVPELSIKDNQELNRDYWNQLAPMAAGYSAGVIGYFQNKFKEIDDKKDERVSESFIETGFDMLAMIWQNANYNFNDVMGTLPAQRATDATVKKYVETMDKANVFTQNTIKATNNVVKTATDVGLTVIKKSKVLGEKITAPAPTSPELKIVTAPKPTPTAIKKITINLIPPANASDLFIDPALGAPVRTAPIPTSGGIAVIDEIINNNLPVNATPIIIPEPIVYPETNIIATPLSLASSSEAVFLFSSDLASSTFEYLLDDISTSSVWQPASTTLTLGNLPDGDHQLRVRAVFAEVADQTPAEFSWTVDTSAPSSQLSALDSSYNQSAFPVSWSRTDAGSDEIFYTIDYMINAGAWQTWIIATSATATIFDQLLQVGDTVGFRLAACDGVSNCETQAEAPQASTQIMPDHLVISAVQTSGLTAKDEWVELYNPTGNDISLAGYKLKKKTATGNESYLVSSFGARLVKAHSYYLIAHPTDYDDAELADSYYSGTSYAVSDDNTVLLYDANAVIDKLGFGTATDTETVSAQNLTSHQRLVRKSTYAGYTSWQGNGLDTNNNRSDFTIVDNYAPHSTDAVTEPRSEAPTLPGATNLEFATSDTVSATLNWLAPAYANLGAGARYEIKYLATTGACTLNKNWRSLPSATGTPEPSLTSGATEQFTLNDLAPGTTYCVAMRTFNGVTWSSLSNQLTFRTACNDTAPRAVNYTTHLSRASTTTVPDQIPEHILVVDYIFSMANGKYDLYGGSTCNRIGQYVPAFGDPASSLTRVEFVYDPETKLFTGKYRRCENGWHYNVTVPEGDHCRDHATAWANSRWNTLPSLAGQSVISLKRLTTGEFTEWLKP